MYPHERSLVKRLEGKPFALLGVNSDSDKVALKKAMAQEQITWRSWWDKSTTGPIATAWNINGCFPTIYILDHKGIIRYRDVRGEAMDKAVDALLREIADKEKMERATSLHHAACGCGPRGGGGEKLTSHRMTVPKRVDKPSAPGLPR